LLVVLGLFDGMMMLAGTMGMVATALLVHLLSAGNEKDMISVKDHAPLLNLALSFKKNNNIYQPLFRQIHLPVATSYSIYSSLKISASLASSKGMKNIWIIAKNSTGGAIKIGAPVHMNTDISIISMPRYMGLRE
jgi:hypothetical protein